LYLQFRDADPKRLAAMEAVLSNLVGQFDTEGPVRAALETIDDAIEPVTMDAAIQDHIARAAEAAAPGEGMRLPSGAAHDAQVIARRLPCGMLFVPSIGGVSHDFIEDTAEKHIVLGCEIAAAAAASILLRQQATP